MNLRPVTQADALLLLDWRNDPLTRANSGNTDCIHLIDHLAWLNEHMSELRIAMLNDVPVGVVRDSGGELSWTVAPEFRRRGIGKAMVSLIADRGKRAKIKSTNLPSIAIAKSCGLEVELL